MKLCRRCGKEPRPSIHAWYCKPCQEIRRAETRRAYKQGGSKPCSTFLVNRTEALIRLMKAMTDDCPGPSDNSSTYHVNSHGVRVVRESPSEDCSTCFFNSAEILDGECLKMKRAI